MVEPAGFRTDFAGRSLTQSTTVIDDYAGTGGMRRKNVDTVHGTQIGDAAKAATAIIEAVQSPESPSANARAAEIDKWEELTTSSDFDG